MSDQLAKIGRVEKIDPHSTDYPLTPCLQTTLRTTPWTTLRTIPWTTLNNLTKFTFMGERDTSLPAPTAQSKQPPFFLSDFLDPVLFHIGPIRHLSPVKTLFSQWMISKRCGILNFLICQTFQTF